MRRASLLALVIGAFALLSPSAFAQTKAQADSPQLRQGVECDAETMSVAKEIVAQGWVYVMPSPKSAQAAWGNRDGRTTWFVGYWKNTKTQKNSSITPTKDSTGKYIGDDRGQAGWRRGGSPRLPTKLEWLCSKSGGVPPAATK